MTRRRLIRWIGDPSPWADPAVARGILEERFSVGVIEDLRRFDTEQKISALPGKSELVLGPTHGFSETYVFGPWQFCAWMQPEDARILFTNEWDRWQFIDITDNPSQTERPRMSKRDWQALVQSFRKLTARRRLKPEYR